MFFYLKLFVCISRLISTVEYKTVAINGADLRRYLYKISLLGEAKKWMGLINVCRKRRRLIYHG